MNLTLEEKRSPCWIKVKAWADGELARLRINLETDAPPEKTAKLRGSIRSLKSLLALENSPAQAVEDAETD